MAKVPNFKHRQLKALAEAVRSSMSVYGGLRTVVRKVGDGWEVSQAPSRAALLLGRRTVALVRKPEALPLADDLQPPLPLPPELPEPVLEVRPLKLVAREVQYKSIPPLAPDTQQDAVVEHLAASNIFPGYEFAGGEFRVYPAIGSAVDDYEQFIVGPDDEMDRSQTYLFAYLEGDNIWVLERPPGGGDFTPVVVRDVRDDDDHFVWVQNVKRDGEDPWVGGMAPTGEAYRIAIWGHGKARDFRALLTRETVFTRATPIIFVVEAIGQPWVLQYLRFDLIQPRSQVRYTDCVSAFVEQP